MHRHFSTGVSTIVALMAAHRAADAKERAARDACHEPMPASSGRAGAGANDVHDLHVLKERAVATTSGSAGSNGSCRRGPAARNPTLKGPLADSIHSVSFWLVTWNGE